MNEEHNPWTILAGKEVYDNKWIKVTEFQVLNPSGSEGIYGKVHFKNYAIGVIPLDEEFNTYLVGQYRFPLNAYSWEIPEGGGPLNEDQQKAAERELLEETGLKAKSWTRILDMHLSNSVCDETSAVFLARGLSQHTAEPEETEQLAIKKLPFEEAYKMVQNGTITDSMSVAAILKVRLMILEGEL